MISKILLTGLFTFFLSGGIVSVTEDCAEKQTVVTTVTDNVMKGIVYEGEVIPLIELPTVEITGERNNNGLVNATIVDGEIYPSIELAEVVITPEA